MPIFTADEAQAGAELFPDGAWTNILADGAHQQFLWARFDPGSIYKLHSHPYEQSSVMLQGRMRLTVGDEVRDIGPGDMWFAAAGVPHGGEILGDESVVFIDVYAPHSGGIGSDVTYY
jgi:quercetin dioxygenase-like cupin family protein